MLSSVNTSSWHNVLGLVTSCQVGCASLPSTASYSPGSRASLPGVASQKCPCSSLPSSSMFLLQRICSVCSFEQGRQEAPCHA